MRIGMIGHSDAGKTVLSEVLKYVCTNEIEIIDKDAEQIDAEFIQSSNLDGLILVISSTDGPMPYTKIHVELASRMKVQPIGIWINKTDIFRLGSEWLEIIEMETRELMSLFGLEDEKVPAVYGSALKALKDVRKGSSESINIANVKDFWGQVERYYLEQIADLK